jgi:hypothetical protein
MTDLSSAAPENHTAQRRRGGRRWIIAGAITLVLVAGGGVYLLASIRGHRYALPADRCTLLDTGKVQGWAGQPTRSTPKQLPSASEVGGDIDGCQYDLQQADDIIGIEIFPAIGENAKARYDRALADYTGDRKYVVKPVQDLGTAAFNYLRQSPDKRQITSAVVLYDNDLFLVVRMIAASANEWDPNTVLGHLTDTSRTIMDALRRA